MFGTTASLYIYSGDGDDEVHQGNDWFYTQTHLGEGNDVYFTNQPRRNSVRAGPGDDKIYNLPLEDTLGRTLSETIRGGDGNDIIYGSHKVSKG